ncbi:hypothetical protein D9M69_697030 [compost metagenome]
MHQPARHDEAATGANHRGLAVDGHFERALGNVAHLHMRMAVQRADSALVEAEFHLHQLGRMDQHPPRIAGRQLDGFAFIRLREQLLFSHWITSPANRHPRG